MPWSCSAVARSSGVSARSAAAASCSAAEHALLQPAEPRQYVRPGGEEVNLVPHQPLAGEYALATLDEPQRPLELARARRHTRCVEPAAACQVGAADPLCRLARSCLCCVALAEQAAAYERQCPSVTDVMREVRIPPAALNYRLHLGE